MQNNCLMGMSRTGVAACMAAAIAALPLGALAADLDMLGTLTKGVWNLRIRDDGSEQRVCVRTGREFIQLRHRQPGCSQVVVRDNPNEVVIQYTCRGNGYGRTSIRREGNGLVQIESQGIADGTPFSISGEARHSGKC
ncbi:hypothetical protein [Croceibacterium selenioxidans]|jgi:hypothetical protein|nr:hypothetical protein [Croceibacterium selenioxidans]